MSLWGKSVAAESRPKGFPDDSNSKYARENIFATRKGWVIRGAATGNDNANADPEILVYIKDLATQSQLGGANIIGVDFTAGAYADGATFQMVLTFDEAVIVTSEAYAAATDSTSDRVYMKLNCLGATDMVSDDTVDMQYLSGSGTNDITFQGLLPTTPNGYLAFVSGMLEFNGSAAIHDKSSIGVLQMEDSTSNDPVTFALDNDGEEILLENSGNQINQMVLETGAATTDESNRVVINSTTPVAVTTNGAVSASTTITVDGVSGTIAVGMTVGNLGGTGISDAFSNTDISNDGTLKVTAVASQTSFTVSEAVTIANNIALELNTDEGDAILLENVDLDLEGFDGATSVIGVAAVKTGDADDTKVTTATDGSSSGEANILTGVTTT